MTPALYTALVMTDGRDDLLERTLDSMRAHLHPLPHQVFVHDDTGDEDHRRRLDRRLIGEYVIGEGQRRGFAGAIQYAWRWLAERVETPWVFHTEDDMVITDHVRVDMMVHNMLSSPELVQLALLRGPVNEAERLAGGVLGTRPDAYTRTTCRPGCCAWWEHTAYWTTNPSLFGAWVIRETEWPDGPDSEAKFGPSVLDSQWVRNPGVTFAYWTDDVLVKHIGHERAPGATGY